MWLHWEINFKEGIEELETRTIAKATTYINASFKLINGSRYSKWIKLLIVTRIFLSSLFYFVELENSYRTTVRTSSSAKLTMKGKFEWLQTLIIEKERFITKTINWLQLGRMDINQANRSRRNHRRKEEMEFVSWWSKFVEIRVDL